MPRLRTSAASALTVVLLALVLAACSSSGAARTPSGTAGHSHPAAQTPTRSAPSTSSSSTGRSQPAVTDVTGADWPSGTGASLHDLRAANPHISFSVRTMTYAGAKRAYLVAAPAARTSGSLPMTVVLSGWRASATFEAERTALLSGVAAGRAVAIYPASYHESWRIPGGDCCHDAGSRGLDDAGFVTAATRDAMSRLPIDPRRVYLVGYSNGGKLALALACGHGDLWVAVATMGAVPQQQCTSDTTPVSVLLAMGTADPDQPADHGHQPPIPLMDAAAAAFRRRDHCAADSSTARPPHAVIVDSPACASGTAVRTVAYDGLGHRWPGEGSYHGEVRVAHAISMSVLITQFFARRHR